MARARLLKPGFFTNEDLAELEPFARLLYAGLWTIADRAGRLEDRPKRIKAALFAYDNVEVDELLTALHQRGFILRYQVQGAAFIQILSFSKHQSPHVREPESVIPAPCGYETGTGPALGQHETGPAVTGNRYAVTGDPESEAETDFPEANASVAAVPSPEGPTTEEPLPLEEVKTKRITDAFRAEMREAFPDLDEEAEFDKATNHVAYRKAIDKRRYYRNWLTNARRYAAERRNDRGTTRRHADQGDDELARFLERNASAPVG